ncbi:MAG: MBL fold metallo-hydrolase [Burkholderiaceae bacterium]
MSASTRSTAELARCGDSLVFSLTDLAASVPAFDLLPQYQPELLGDALHALAPHYLDAQSHLLHLSFRCWIVRTPRHVVLIDSCIGNDKERPGFPPFHRLGSDFLSQLAATGLQPSDIDFVCCTHLHADHCGWNTRRLDGRWVPTFPNAKYLFSRQELDYWTRQAPGSMGPHEGVYQDSVLPVIEAGLAQVIDGAWDVDDHLRVRPAPGHTAGHYAVHLHDAQAGAVFCGDVVHHPVQIARPEWNSAFCQLPDIAVETRRQLLRQAAEENLLLFPAHFSQSGFGSIHARGDQLQYVPGMPGHSPSHAKPFRP